jgi:hypothetical protein
MMSVPNTHQTSGSAGAQHQLFVGNFIEPTILAGSERIAARELTSAARCGSSHSPTKMADKVTDEGKGEYE